MPLFEFKIDDHYDIHFPTQTPTTGAATAADSTPTFVTVEGGATHQIVDTGTCTKIALLDLTAAYQICSQATAAKGFEVGKWYAVFAKATVGGTAGEEAVAQFIIVPADVVREDVWTDAKAAFVDVSIASRSSHTAANVWTSATRTLTSYGTLVADVATAVWAAGTRSLTSFGTLVADTAAASAAAVWAAGTRTLTSYGTLVADVATAVWAATTRTLTSISDTIWATLNTYLVAQHGEGAWNRGWNMAVTVQNTTLTVTGGLIDGDGHIWLTRDDDHDIDITLKDAAGTAINISADTLYLTCRESDEETATTDADATFQVLGTVVSGVNGQARFEVGKTQTDTLTLNRHYYYDICLIAAHGDVITPIKGRLTNTGDSTRRTA